MEATRIRLRDDRCDRSHPLLVAAYRRRRSLVVSQRVLGEFEIEAPSCSSQQMGRAPRPAERIRKGLHQRVLRDEVRSLEMVRMNEDVVNAFQHSRSRWRDLEIEQPAGAV